MKVAAAEGSIVRPQEALTLGDTEGAFSFYASRLERIADNGALVAEYAVLAANLGRDEAVRESLPHLYSVDEYRLLSLGLAIRLGVSEGKALDEILADLAAYLRKGESERILESLAEFPPTRPLRKAHHIAICGISFCGSTLLDRILGSAEGVASIGESHWLARFYDGKSQGSIDIREIRKGKAPMCTRCGEDCAYLTPQFRTSLALNPINWYDQIATRLNASILVSADKNLPKLLKHDPLLRFTALISFKSPAQSWLSRLRKLPTGLDSRLLRDEFDQWIDMWLKSYDRLLNRFAPAGGKVILDFDAFSRRPESALEHLLCALGLPHDPTLLDSIAVGHAIGGNGATARALRGNFGKTDIVGRTDDELPAEHLRWIFRRKDAQELHGQLVSCAINC